MRIIFSIAILFAAIAPVFADFGFVLSEGFLSEHKDETAFVSKTTIAPWFSVPIGSSDLYLSAGISANYEEEMSFIPELFRLELTLRPSADFGVRAGRIHWQDTSRLAAFGYFDGAELFLNLGAVQLGAAGFYTGFLYRETASINISPGDPADYSADFDWADFGGTYFAPRRFITSIYGDFPCFPIGRGNIHAGLLAQFDFSDAKEAINTQYLLLRYTFYYRRFDFAASGAAELENTKAGGFKPAFAFSAEGGFQTSLLKDRLSFGLRYASGSGPDTAAFFPLIREAQGVAFTPVFSGIMILRARYQARFLPSLAAQLGGRYFIRTDTATYADSFIDNDSKLLGAEVDGSILWAPFSDLSFSLEGGIYFPQTGQAMSSGAPLRWSLNIGAIFSF